MSEWGAVLPAMLAGLCAALSVSSPAQRVARVARGSDPIEGAGAGLEAAGQHLWAARADSPPLWQRVSLACLAAVAVALAAGPVLGSLGWLVWVAVPLLTAAGVVVLGRLEPQASREREQRLVLELPQALDLLSSCLAAGMPLRQAAGAVAAAFEGSVAQDLGDVLARVDLGVSDVEAWRTLRAHPHWGAAAVDLARSAESGTMMVEVLAHHARDARTRRRAALEVRAKSVGVRSVLPLMTCFLPAFMLVGVVPTVASAVRNALF